MLSCARVSWLLALGLVASSCKEAPTQLVVVVDSDLLVPDELASVEVRAAVTGRAEVVSTFDVDVPAGSMCTESACPLPLSVGVVPATNDDTDQTVITVIGFGPSREVVVERTARTGFIKGKRLALHMVLEAVCRGQTCGADSTCVGGECGTSRLDPRGLAEVPPGVDPSQIFDPVPAGARDAAIQVAEDASTAPDAFELDAGVAEDVGSMTPEAGAAPDAAPDAAPMAPDASSPPAMLDWVRSTVSSVQNLEFLRSEVTVDQFAACRGAGACGTDSYRTMTLNPGVCTVERSELGDHPATCVKFAGAEAFCSWAGGRLPTEDEWYAEASNGGTRIYPWGGPDATCEYAVIDAAPNGQSCGRGQQTWPVCSKRAGDSVSGLCDMLGNVTEATSTMENGRIIVRGMAYLSQPHPMVGVQWRRRDTALEYPWFGFRCVREAM